MAQEVFKICRSGNGLVLLGVSIPQGLSPNDVFFSTPLYGKTKYVCTPRAISIPSKIEFEGELLDVVEICGHPFEECDDLEELIIPETIRKIHWNGCGRAKLSKFTVHPDNPVFQDIEGVLYTRKGYNRDGKKKYNWIELIAYPSGKGTEYKVPDGVTRLGNQSFKYTSISHLELPNTLREIGANVFYGCQYLKELEVPSSVIRDEGSRNCSTLFKTNNHG
jgi:hypothetical protein